MIGLGMKPRSFGIVGDAHFDVWHSRQPFNGRSIGSAHVGCGDDPHRNVTLPEVFKGRHQQAQPRPFDK